MSREPRSSEVYELPNTSVTLVLSGKSMRQALFGHKRMALKKDPFIARTHLFNGLQTCFRGKNLFKVSIIWHLTKAREAVLLWGPIFCREPRRVNFANHRKLSQKRAKTSVFGTKRAKNEPERV